ncbi:MAG: hypothetical protein IKB90_07870 [Alistipes sp.]|nr:hypothetical protein [Alistipes sp.]
MRNFFTKMMVIVAMLFAGSALMTACTPDQGDDYKGPPVLEVGEPNVINAMKVEIPLNAKKLTSIGYKLVAEGENAPASAMMVFRSGKKIDGCPSMLTLTGNDGLDLGKKFTLYVVATISDTEFYNNGEMLTAEFTTPNDYADDFVYIKRTTSEGADIVVNIPEEVKQKGRRIKWGIANIAMLKYYGDAPTPEKLFTNDQMYPALLFKNDTTLNINHYNIYRRNEKGEIGYYYFAGYNANGNVIIDECSPNDPMVSTGEAEPVTYYQHFQPGEPLVLMLSEVDYADCPYLAALEGDAYVEHLTNPTCGHLHPMIDWSWGPGWYWYPYDYQAYIEEVNGNRDPGELPMPGVGGGNAPTIDFDKFWHEGAFYRKLEFTLPGPDKFETGSVIVNTSGLKTDGGKITFTPTGDTFAYLVTVCADRSEVNAGYFDLLKYVNNDPSLLQWLTTSEVGAYLGIYPFYTSEGTVVLDLASSVYSGDIKAGMKYHVIVNAVPGKMQNGDMALDVSKQAFQHITFTLPEYKLPEPELVVTAYESYSPYKVKFNIKNPNYETLPVKKVVYAANETREFSSYMATYGYTYEDIVLANDGYANLTEAEVEQVNSDFGYDMEFEVSANTRFTLAAMGWNTEGRPSTIGEGSKAVAEAISTDIPSADPLDMTKLNALKGDWTATATVKTYDYNTGGTSSAQKSWKVTIGDLSTNNSLSEADYAVFEAAGVNKAAADAYLAQFNELAANYNASVLGQNRVLCQGWDLSGTRETSTASPWDLFLMPDYNASLVDYLFNDFGPKWFLQTDADGNIFVPVNYNVIQPMMCWYNGMDHYLCSGNYEKGYANYINPADPMGVQSVGIPVEISEDGNTVTLKSVTIKPENEEIQLYPTMVYDAQGQLAFYNPYVMSEVVLTKGWNGGATPAPAKASSSKHLYGKKVVNGGDFKSPAKVYSRTVFAPATKKVEKTTVANIKFPTKEEIQKNLDKMMQKYNRTLR